MRLPPAGSMRLLDRMLLREISLPLGVGVLAILQLLVVAQLLQLNEVVFTASMRVADLGLVTLALAPHFLVMAVPLAFMLGVQLGLGRLAADNELLALSAAGRSPLELFRVPLAIALALSVAVAAMARWAEPWGLRLLNSALNEVIKRNLESGLLPGVFNEGLPRFMIYVASEEKGPGRYANWRGVLIEDDVGEGKPLLALADEGRIEDDAGETLSLHLHRGELHRFEEKGETVSRFDDGIIRVGVGSGVRKNNRFAGNESQLSDEQLGARIAELEAEGDHRYASRMRLEAVRRWAVPWACLAFAFLGVPLAVVARGARGSAYLITMGAFLGFYALSRVSLALAEAGANPWLVGFMPDGVIAAVGLFYTVQLVRNGVGKAR